jgi:hypothetical protein
MSAQSCETAWHNHCPRLGESTHVDATRAASRPSSWRSRPQPSGPSTAEVAAGLNGNRPKPRQSRRRSRGSSASRTREHRSLRLTHPLYPCKSQPAYQLGGARRYSTVCDRLHSCNMTLESTDWRRSPPAAARGAAARLPRTGAAARLPLDHPTLSGRRHTSSLSNRCPSWGSK